MKVIIILIALILLWRIFGRRIRMWFAGFMARRTEDYIRKATGLPPRPGSKEDRRRQKEARQQQAASSGGPQSSHRHSSGASSGGTSSRRQRNHYGHREPLIPKEYAEDVEFTEIISYSETTIGIRETDGRQTVYHESQVSDVEWTEIKLSKR